MFRKIMIAVLLFGAAGAAVGAGTFASFSASTTNAGSTFAAGTLVLSNKVNTGSVCFSSADGVDTNAKNCSVLFTETAKKPGATVYTADITVKNEGSLDGTTLSLYRSAACANGDDAGTIHGLGNPCSAIQMTIQEYSDAFTTASACRYDADNAGATCAFDASRTLNHFSTTYTGSGAALGLGAMTASTTRYFRVSITFPDGGDTDNAYQGRTATFGLVWRLV